jgi:hypothetical protein
VRLDVWLVVVSVACCLAGCLVDRLAGCLVDEAVAFDVRGCLLAVT